MNTVFLYYESKTHHHVRVPFCRTELGERVYRRSFEGVTLEVVVADKHWLGRVVEGETTTNYYGTDASVLEPCLDRILERHPEAYREVLIFELEGVYPKSPLFSPFGWMTPCVDDFCEFSWSLEFPDGNRLLASLNNRYRLEGRLFECGQLDVSGVWTEETWFWVLRIDSENWMEESDNGFGSLFEKFYDWLRSEIERGNRAKSYLDFAARDRVERPCWWDRISDG